MASNPSRTCPACGARNNDRSLFCAECGVGLATTTDNWNDDSQQTQSFEPVRDDTDWHRPADTRQRTSSEDIPVSGSPPEYASFDHTRQDQPVALVPARAPESSRGFWLGVLAWLLIAVVVGMYIWAGVLGEQLKDDIRDIVPGLSQVLILR